MNTSYNIGDLAVVFIVGAVWGMSGLSAYQAIRRILRRRRRQD
jgi:hypothetical protein